jgi:hypothetical protein
LLRLCGFCGAFRAAKTRYFKRRKLPAAWLDKANREPYGQGRFPRNRGHQSTAYLVRVVRDWKAGVHTPPNLRVRACCGTLQPKNNILINVFGLGYGPGQYNKFPIQ